MLAGAFLVIPPAVFWIAALLYRLAGIGHTLMAGLAGLESSPAGIVLMVTMVIGCPFLALPLTVIGRWLARVKGEKGIRLGSAVIAVSVILLVLGLVLPLVLR